MKYLKVVWHHDFPGEPVTLFSEIDEERYEVRKVEVYRDGRHEFASEVTSTGATMLGEIETPSIEELAEQEEFTPTEIDHQEFETVWRRATRGKP
ncbi:hypothetical protein RB628_37240 [Streptomyces sp. ADMS]|uniref:DUF6881 domain-containing protein n=1 Tax=Streptomyces sp. ADMS TaxID=3071415 RepID=UPI00296EA9A4|nr:hypothetical protein [Streptomyces sp. ADMS]MDW4910815.1 hypothetical protein [Streptomyces sp. ADMS]